MCSSASQPGAPRRSKQASWGLTATTAGATASISARQWARTAAAVSRRATTPALGGLLAGRLLRVGEGEREPCPRFARAIDRRRPQLRRVGIDAEHDLGLTFGDGRTQPIAERQTGARPSVALLGRVHGWLQTQPGAGRNADAPRGRDYLTAFLRPEPAVKRGTLLAEMVIVSPVRGLRPSRAPRSATWNLPNPVKLTSSPEPRAVSIELMHRVDGSAGVLLAEAGLLGNLVDELVLRHASSCVSPLGGLVEARS